MAEQEMEVHLRRMLRRTSVMRQGFYLVVLVVALAGQVSGAVEALGIPLAAAVPAVAALELGGVVVLANADVRRRLGERAVASRLLSVAIAAAAVAFNWLAHTNHLLGGFFAGMSALGYLVWLMHTENQRRDRLRAKGDLPPTTPAYEVVDHWLRHPWLTHRAKSMAKADAGLGLYESLAAARAEVRRERRQAAISKVLHRKIRAAVDPNTADIAVAVYDLDEIAIRLADGADYDGLTALIAADLAPARLGLDTATLPVASGAPAADPTTRARESAQLLDAPAAVPPATSPAASAAGISAATAPPAAVPPGAAAIGPAVDSPTIESPIVERPPRVTGRAEPVLVLDPSVRRSLEELGLGRQPEPAPTSGTPGDEPGRRDRTRRATGGGRPTTPVVAGTAAGATGPLSDTLPAAVPSAGGQRIREGSLRSQVHTALDEHVPAGEQRDESTLIELVTDVLDLDDVERLTAATYVHSWSQDGSRVAVPAGGTG
jgi:hypothetical protein